MRNKAIVRVRRISVQLFFIFCAFLLMFGSPAHGAETAQKQSITRGPALNLEMLKILPVLEEAKSRYSASASKKMKRETQCKHNHW